MSDCFICLTFVSAWQTIPPPENTGNSDVDSDDYPIFGARPANEREGGGGGVGEGAKTSNAGQTTAVDKGDSDIKSVSS